jgi:hypothetical protein
VPTSDGLIQHLETFLGPIAGGWTEDAAGARLPFQVVRFEGRPRGNVVTYAILGLSRHVLELPSKTVRQELVMAVDRAFATTDVVGVLATVGELLLERHMALLRGEVLPPRDPLVAGSRLDALYAAQPVMLPDEFAVFAGSDPPTVFVWLVPVSAREAAIIGSHGWDWFEEQLVAQQPDLFDLARGDIAH